MNLAAAIQRLRESLASSAVYFASDERCDQNPRMPSATGRFIGVLEMIYFPVWQLVAALEFLQGIQTQLAGMRGHGHRDVILPKDILEDIAKRVMYARTRCSSLELESAVTRIDDHVLRTLAKPSANVDQVFNQIKVLRELIESDLKWRRFGYVPTDRAKKLDRVEHDWADVQSHFKSAKDDIREAVECYALDCNTASVFHSMRIAERGLRALARKLGVKRIGPQKHPLEFAEWGQVLSALRGKLNSIQQSAGRSVRKAASAKFYADAASQADYLNEIWRKEVSHARGPYNAPEALNALTRTHDFMTLLSQRIKER